MALQAIMADEEAKNDDARADGLVRAPGIRRVWASLAEGVLLGGVVLLLFVALSENTGTSYILAALIFVGAIAYGALKEGIPGGSFGRRLLGIKCVVYATGMKCGYLRSVRRWLSQTAIFSIPGLNVVLALMEVSTLMSPSGNGRTWVDRAAGTWIVLAESDRGPRVDIPKAIG